MKFINGLGYSDKLWSIDDIIEGRAMPTFYFQTKDVTYRAHTLQEAGKLWAADGMKLLEHVGSIG